MFPQLKECGYTHIDALDGSEEMLGKAEQLGIYDKCVHAWVGGPHKIPLPDSKI